MTRIKPNRPEAPVIQLEDHWDPETRILSYTYALRTVFSLHIPGTGEPAYRHDSDGTLNSIPLMEQLYFMLKEDVTGTVTINLGPEAVNMLPNRVKPERAILGQVGLPLIEGVNGLYDISDDFILSWYGRPWRWLSDRLERDKDGNLVARMEVELGKSSWFVNFKPHYYRMHHGYKFHEPWKFRPRLEPVSGWCSWEACRRNVSQDGVNEVAEFCGKNFQPYGLTYVQLDDGFQKMPLPSEPDKPIPHAWLDCDPSKFAEGHEGIIESVKNKELKPGIWTSVSIYNEEFADHFPDDVVRYADGTPILGDWIKLLLTCEPENLERHVVPHYKQLSEMGYDYFKTDVTRHLHFDGYHKAVEHGDMTWQDAERRYRAFMEAGRRAMGDEKFWLLSWGVMMEGAGVVDACRISMDALPTWSGLRMQIIESARWWHTHRIVWQNDPDHVCVRSNKEWSRSVLSLVSLTGQLLMLSDSIDKYDDERVYMIQRCLPPLQTTTAETGPLDDTYSAFTWTKFHGFGVLDDPPYSAEDMDDDEAREMAGWSETMDDNHPLGGLWAFHIDNEVGRWCVVLRTGVFPLPASTVALENLNLPDGKYVAFDFWQQKYLGVVSGELACDPIKLGHCQVIALRPVAEHPQLISSSRHVSQDAVSVTAQFWEKKELSLTLKGVVGDTETYWFHLPKGFSQPQAAGEGLDVADQSVDGECLGVKVTFTDAQSGLKLKF